jgi:hypothetical protein
MSPMSRSAAARGAGRFVGRIGALAVSLGIGVAIANCPGVAMADDGGSESSSTGQSSSGPSSDSPSSDNDSSKTAKPADTKDSDTDTAPKATDAKETDADSKSESKTESESESEPEKPNSRTSKSTAADTTAADTTATETTDTETTVAIAATTITTETPAAAAVDAADEPSVPAPAPALWATLAWARREVGHAVSTTSAGGVESTTSTSQVQPAVSIAATSPLGTQQQLDAERIAARTVNTLPVALMKMFLRFGFQSAANQQFSSVGGPDQANLDQLGAAVNEYAMAAAFQQQILNSNAPTVVTQVAPPHTWYGQMVPGSRILYDNPDTVYRFMGVNGASSYVITGRFDGETPADTSFSVLTGFTGNTASVLTKDQLVVNPDGTFTITADRNPANGRVNHLQLTNDTTLIATRNTLADWNTEMPMSLAIERIGGPPNSLFSQLGGFAIPVLGPTVVSNPLLTALVSLIPPMADPPPFLRGVVTAVIMALGVQREATYMAIATTDPVTGERIPPNVLKNPTRNAEFLATQLQSAGYFQLADDEALVVTIDPGNAGYFVVPVTNDWTISDDYWNQQTSLNSAQTLINDDMTTYTVVISKSDPGVANWVSTGGLNQGTISMRFQDLDPGAPDDLPTVTSRVVKLNELDETLPEGTVHYTAAQRTVQLAARKAGFNNRFAPYPQP